MAVWLEEFRQSDLSVKHFCELIEVSVATFYNWQRKLRQPTDVRGSSETSLAAPVHFVEAFISTKLNAMRQTIMPIIPVSNHLRQHSLLRSLGLGETWIQPCD